MTSKIMLTSLVFLSLCRKLRLYDLQPTNLSVQLIDHSIKHLAGFLEDVSIQVVKFIIPCDFIVIGMDESS